MKPRIKTKLWLFNCLSMLLPYTVFVVMNFIFRISYINNSGVCIIGMQKIAMLPLIIFEVVVNIYLTALFVIPIRSLYSYKHDANSTLHRMAKRSLVGSLATLTTSVINLTILMVLKGEPGWICLMCCNTDILFCVLVLHWVTSKDKQTMSTSPQSGVGTDTIGSGNGTRSGHKRSSTMIYGDGTIEKRSDITTIKRLSDDTQNTTPTTNNSRNTSSRNSRIPSLRIFPYSISTLSTHRHPQISPRLVLASVTTECMSSSPPPSRFRASSRGLHRISPTREDFGDEVELNNIRVQTIHTREVEIDDDDDGWEGTESVRNGLDMSEERLERMLFDHP